MGARLVWTSVVGCMLGVFARSVFSVGFSYVGVLLLFALTAGVIGFIDRKKISAMSVAALFCVAAILGILRTEYAIHASDPVLDAYLGRQVTIEGVVSTEPDVRDNSVRVSVRASKIISPVRSSVRAGIIASLPAHAPISYGDIVHVYGTLRAPQTFDTGYGRTFNYPGYLASAGIEYQISLAQAEVIQNSANVGNPLQAGAIWVKETFERGVAAALPEPEAGLASGITVGNKRSIGSELSSIFQQVGLVHVVVLSGYNITVVLNAFARILAFAPRTVQFGASGFLVAFFVLMAGGAASAVRAGIMALVAVLARATRRQFVAGRALAFAALLIVMWNPLELVFDPSFQLSALATLGLVYITPFVDRWVGWIPKRLALREIVSSTLATQTAVLPLLLYQNGQLPIYALPANVLALVAVPPAMFFAFIAGTAGAVVGSSAVFIALPAHFLLWYIVSVARLFASMPYATLSIGVFSAWWLFAVYATLICGAFFGIARLNIQKR